MEKIKLSGVTIRNIIQEKELLNIVLETGNENVYIPNEHKFIVTKKFLSEATHVFSRCFTLKKIDMAKFDFSEIITMTGWFWKSKNLSEIIFPKYTNLLHLESLSTCFAKTNLSVIDLSFMECKETLNFEDAFFKAKARKIVAKTDKALTSFG